MSQCNIYMDVGIPDGFLTLKFTFCSKHSETTSSACESEIQLCKLMCSMKSVTVSSLLILALNIICGCFSQCHHSEYLIGSDCCPKCPPGKRVKTDCTQIRSTSCMGCLEGTFMDQPNGLKRCFLCQNCDADSGLKVKTSCMTTSDTVCEPLEGFYCVDLTDGGCAAAKKHKSCKPGQYISERGTMQRDTVCSDCSDGTYSDGNFTSCRPHTQCQSMNLQLIKAGSVSADAECGPAGPDWTGLTAGLVVGLILIVAGAVAVGCFKKRKKYCFTEKDEKAITKREKEKDKAEHQRESRDPMLDDQSSVVAVVSDRCDNHYEEMLHEAHCGNLKVELVKEQRTESEIQILTKQ